MVFRNTLVIHFEDTHVYSKLQAFVNMQLSFFDNWYLFKFGDFFSETGIISNFEKFIQTQLDLTYTSDFSSHSNTLSIEKRVSREGYQFLFLSIVGASVTLFIVKRSCFFSLRPKQRF